MVNKYFKGRLMDKLSSEQLFRQSLIMLVFAGFSLRRSKEIEVFKKRQKAVILKQYSKTSETVERWR